MPPDEKPFHNPFASLKDKLGDLPRGPVREEGPGRKGKEREPPAKGPARAVVRLERKGRGGKEVTVVEQLGLGAAQLEEWLVALKSALGCGGASAAGSLVLQGDQRKRLPKLLEARGVRRVIVG
jgi:translation initiation factor 1